MKFQTLKKAIIIATVFGMTSINVLAKDQLRFQTTLHSNYLWNYFDAKVISKVPSLDSILAEFSFNNFNDLSKQTTDYTRVRFQTDAIKRFSNGNFSFFGRLIPSVTTTTMDNKLEFSLDYELNARYGNANVRINNSKKEISYTQPFELGEVGNKATASLSDTSFGLSLNSTFKNSSLSISESLPYEGEKSTNIGLTYKDKGDSIRGSFNISEELDNVEVRAYKDLEKGSLSLRFYINPEKNVSSIMGEVKNGDLSLSGKFVHEYGRDETEVSISANGIKITRKTNPDWDSDYYRGELTFPLKSDTTATISGNTNGYYSVGVSTEF